MGPIAFQLGNFSIKWYGIFYAVGFLFAYWLTPILAKSRNISKEDMQDFFVYLIPSSILGGRLAHILGSWDFYSQNLSQVFAVWNGGMVFHGGLLGGAIATYYYCKKKDIHFYDLADILVVPLALALSLGRIGNFLNSEFYGPITNLPWGVEFQSVEGKRHPTQIYESIKNLFIFIVLFKTYTLNKYKKGFIFWLFVLFYSTLRFFVEYLRVIDTYLFGFTWGQLISLPLIFISYHMVSKLRK